MLNMINKTELKVYNVLNILLIRIAQLMQFK